MWLMTDGRRFAVDLRLQKEPLPSSRADRDGLVREAAGPAGGVPDVQRHRRRRLHPGYGLHPFVHRLSHGVIVMLPKTRLCTFRSAFRSLQTRSRACHCNTLVRNRPKVYLVVQSLGTASEAAVVALLAARSRSLQGRPESDMSKLVVYTSDQVSAQNQLQGMVFSITTLGHGKGTAISAIYPGGTHDYWHHVLRRGRP